METPAPSLQIEEHGPPGASEAVVLLMSGVAAGADLVRRVARFARVVVIRWPVGVTDDADLSALLDRLGVERAHLVVVADPAAAVAAHLQQIVSID